MCFSPRSVLSGALTRSALRSLSRTGLSSLLLSLSSPLQSHVRNMVIIKSHVSGLQEVTCRE